MKKRLLIISVLLIVFGISAFAFATFEWWDNIEWEEDSSTNLAFVSTGVGWRNIGVVSSGDLEDWYRYNPRVNGIGQFELDLETTGIDADIYLCNEMKTILYKGYTEGTSKKITNIFLPANTIYYIKVEYKSGVPKKPYEHYARLDGLTMNNLSTIQNIEDVPLSEIQKLK